MNRDPKSSKPPIKPKRFFNFAELKEDTGISKKAVRALFSLAESNLLPGWALQQIHKDIQDLDAMHDPKMEIHGLRALIGEGALLLAPTISGDEVETTFAIWLNPGEEVSVYDVEFNKPGREPTESDIYVIKSEMTPGFGGYSTGNYLEIVSYGGN